MTYNFIVPVYNVESYLQRCCQSMANQELPKSLFLIDDGSWDASSEQVDEIALADADVITIHEKNAGPSAARNKGILLSSSDYILFVDSDDYITDTYLSTIDRALCEHPTDVLIFGVASSISKTVPAESGTAFGKTQVLAHYRETWNTVDYYSSCNKAFSRNLFSRNRLLFMDDSTVEEDFVLNLRVLDCAESFSQMTDVLYYYNQRETGSLTTSYNPKRFEGKKVSFKEEIRLLSKWEMPELVHYQQQQLVNFVSVAVNNLLYKECQLSHREKIGEIQRYFNDPTVRECAKTVKPSSLRVKMMVVFIKGRLYRTCFLVHALVRLLKKR